MEASTINGVAIQIATVALFAVVVFIWALWYRGKIARRVVIDGEVLVESINSVGGASKKLIKPEGNTLRKISKDRDKLWVYNISQINTYKALYPEGWCPGFFQSPCSKVLIDEMSFEPLSNRTARLQLSPLRFANILYEKWSSMGAERSIDENEAIKQFMPQYNKKKRGGTGGLKWVLIIVAIAVVVSGAIFGYNKWKEHDKAEKGIACHSIEYVMPYRGVQCG